MKTEKSCGAIVFRKGKQATEFLLIKHSPLVGGHWDFPKGHMEAGETEQETALREVNEEAGLQVRLIEGFREEISYVDQINKVNKVVVFFVGEAISLEAVCDGNEVVECCWLEYDLALGRLTYENAKKLLRKVELFLNENEIISLCN